jgi:predicted transcriptional regulator
MNFPKKTKVLRGEAVDKKIRSKLGKRPKTMAKLVEQTGISAATVRTRLMNMDDVIQTSKGRTHVFHLADS